MTKRKWQFYALLFVLFSFINVFFIIRGIADIIDSGITTAKFIGVFMLAVLVIMQARLVILGIEKSRKSDLK